MKYLNDSDTFSNNKPDSFLKTWKKRKSLNIIINGLIASLPVLILLLLIQVIFNLILSIIAPISYLITPGSLEPHWIYHVISALLLLGLFYLIGTLYNHHSGNRYIKHFEREYLFQIPLYTTVRDLVNQFTQLKKVPFSQVVLIDPYDNGVLMTGFVTDQVSNDIYTIFVPTAPNPTNGNIFHVPLERIKFVKANSDSALRTIVGMGTGSSCLFSPGDAEKLKDIVNGDH